MKNKYFFFANLYYNKNMKQIADNYGLKITFYKRLVPHVNPSNENFDFGTFQYFNGIKIDKVEHFKHFDCDENNQNNIEECYYEKQRLYLFSLKDITENKPVYINKDYIAEKLPYLMICQLKLKNGYIKDKGCPEFYFDFSKKIQNSISNLINSKVIKDNLIYDIYGSLGATEVVLLFRLDNFFDGNIIVNKIRTLAMNSAEDCNHILFSSYTTLCYSLDKAFNYSEIKKDISNLEFKVTANPGHEYYLMNEFIKDEFKVKSEFGNYSFTASNDKLTDVFDYINKKLNPDSDYYKNHIQHLYLNLFCNEKTQYIRENGSDKPPTSTRRELLVENFVKKINEFINQKENWQVSDNYKKIIFNLLIYYSQVGISIFTKNEIQDLHSVIIPFLEVCLNNNYSNRYYNSVENFINDFRSSILCRVQSTIPYFESSLQDLSLYGNTSKIFHAYSNIFNNFLKIIDAEDYYKFFTSLRNISSMSSIQYFPEKLIKKTTLISLILTYQDIFSYNLTVSELAHETGHYILLNKQEKHDLYNSIVIAFSVLLTFKFIKSLKKSQYKKYFQITNNDTEKEKLKKRNNFISLKNASLKNIKNNFGRLYINHSFDFGKDLKLLTFSEFWDYLSHSIILLTDYDTIIRLGTEYLKENYSDKLINELFINFLQHHLKNVESDFEQYSFAISDIIADIFMIKSLNITELQYFEILNKLLDKPIVEINHNDNYLIWRIGAVSNYFNFNLPLNIQDAYKRHSSFFSNIISTLKNIKFLKNKQQNQFNINNNFFENNFENIIDNIIINWYNTISYNK